MNETLRELLDRRLHEMGSHRGEQLSLLEAYNAIPGRRDDLVTYEVLRRVWTEGHTRIGDKAVRTLATMLDVDEDVVRHAAGQRPKLGPFTLPARADKLTERERAVVLAVVDAILGAAESVTSSAGSGKTEAMVAAQSDYDVAARTTGRRTKGQQLRDEQDRDANS